MREKKNDDPQCNGHDVTIFLRSKNADESRPSTRLCNATCMASVLEHHSSNQKERRLLLGLDADKISSSTSLSSSLFTSLPLLKVFGTLLIHDGGTLLKCVEE